MVVMMKTREDTVSVTRKHKFFSKFCRKLEVENLGRTDCLQSEKRVSGQEMYAGKDNNRL